MKGVVGTGSRVRGLDREARSLIALSWGRWAAALGLSLSAVFMVGEPRSSLLAAAVNTRAAHFISISAGVSFSCGVLSGGHALCWGDNDTNQTEVPSGYFSQIESSSYSACGLSPGGRVRCWGLTGDSAAPPGERFLSLGTGWGFACGVERSSTTSGPIVCFGPGVSKRPVVSGSFTQVSAGDEAVCGITTSKSIGCGSLVRLPASTLPDHIPVGRFSSIGVGSDVTAPYPYRGETACAVRTDGSLACWGNNQFGQTRAPRGRFEQVGVGSEFVCGLRTSGALVCWGSVPSVGLPPSGRFVHLSVGESDACAVRADRTAVCWGLNNSGEDAVPAESFREVSVGSDSGCAIRSDGSMACWGGDTDGVPPAGTFVHVSVAASGTYACAIRSSHSAACWPHAKGCCGLPQTAPPKGTFTDISAGEEDACAVRMAGAIACWGADPSANVPKGQFTQVSVGVSTACAIAKDAELSCWSVYAGAPPLPSTSGKFRQVQVNQDDICGLTVSWTIKCWWPANLGSGVHSGTVVMPGKYVMLGAEGPDTCGLTAQGRIRCGGECTGSSPKCGHWLWYSGPWATQRYTTISLSWSLCGVRPSGGLLCWGEPTLRLPVAPRIGLKT